ncbi:hypothetical protein [Aeromonas schubertii]|uniref:Uncharacterized protein n=2 Tax=Aeromonas TaxID=642 RepID=A0A0S2SPE4_9GAMM|nr:hypothetical protein [Aeromonas schubertii]ALP43629.1 hypothetical protein WL1483_4210 [Aeromonas schubertii]
MELSIKVNSLQEVGHAASFPGFEKIGRLDINGLTYRVDYHDSQPSVRRDANLGYLDRIKEFCTTAWEDKSLFSHRTTRITQMLPRDIALSNKDGGEPIRCALYGGTNIRGDMSDALSHLGVSKDIKLETIDEYNSALGIAWPLTIDSYFSTQENAAKGLLSNHIKPKELGEFASGYPSQHTQDKKVEWQRERVTQWADFLHQNHDRIDILGKLKNKSEDEIKSFLTKNVPPYLLEPMSPQEITTLAKELKDISAMPSPDDRRAALANLGDAYTVEKMLNTAFFRQTSKLGLEFFQSTGAKVAFAWQDFDGREVERRDLHTKPWKSGMTRAPDYNEPITYSEMRHVERHPELDVTRFKVTK